MKSTLDLVAFILFLQGAGSLIHHFLDWFTLFALVQRSGFLQGHEVVASVVLLAAAALLSLASKRYAPEPASSAT